jgi:hypothetical protein
MTKNNNSIFPPWEEFKKIVERMSKSSRRTNRGLTLDATPLDRAKYNICQIILNHQQEHSIPINQLTKKLKISNAKLERILYSHYDKLTLDELFSYAADLLTPLKVQFIRKERTDIIYNSQQNLLLHTYP